MLTRLLRVRVGSLSDGVGYGNYNIDKTIQSQTNKKQSLVSNYGLYNPLPPGHCINKP